jgi:hypothetical protein
MESKKTNTIKTKTWTLSSSIVTTKYKRNFIYLVPPPPRLPNGHFPKYFFSKFNIHRICFNFFTLRHYAQHRQIISVQDFCVSFTFALKRFYVNICLGFSTPVTAIFYTQMVLMFIRCSNTPCMEPEIIFTYFSFNVRYMENMFQMKVADLYFVSCKDIRTLSVFPFWKRVRNRHCGLMSQK